jgi:hypothetical protein
VHGAHPTATYGAERSVLSDFRTTLEEARAFGVGRALIEHAGKAVVMDDWENHWRQLCIGQPVDFDVAWGEQRSMSYFLTLLVRLQEILDRCPPFLDRSPLAVFNRVYIDVNRRIDVLIQAGVNDPAFLEVLTLELGVRYLADIGGWVNGKSGPPAVWAVLFRYGDGASPPVPRMSAAAGMTALVNFDLPVALVRTFESYGFESFQDDARRADYRLIGEAFAAPLSAAGGLAPRRSQLLVEAVAGDLDEGSPQKTGDYARDVPWRNAERLWPLRHDPADFDAGVRRLDRAAATVSNLLISRFGECFG